MQTLTNHTPGRLLEQVKCIDIRLLYLDQVPEYLAQQSTAKHEAFSVLTIYVAWCECGGPTHRVVDLGRWSYVLINLWKTVVDSLPP